MGGPRLSYFREAPSLLGEYAVSVSYPPATWKPGTNRITNFSRDELKVSVGHPGPPYRSGGPFLVFHEGEWRYRVKGLWKKGLVYYKGEYEIRTLPQTVASIPDLTTTLFGLGATGIARARPGQAGVSLATFLGELREFPHLWKPGGSPLKQNAKGFLGTEFGLKPFLADLRRLYETQQNLSKRLNQLRRDNGRNVRRRLSLGIYEDTETVNYSGGYVSPTTCLDYGTHNLVLTKISKAKYWYSGRFRYWIPNTNDPVWPQQAIQGLYGLDISPEVVWNLVPWTWLYDWFSNIGDIMSNLSANAAENLVQDYGYTMGTVEHIHDYALSTSAGNGSLLHLKAKRYKVLKQRVAAFPWGFGPDPGPLSDRQLAILGALGLTRWGK